MVQASSLRFSIALQSVLFVAVGILLLSVHRAFVTASLQCNLLALVSSLLCPSVLKMGMLPGDCGYGVASDLF